MRQVNRARRKKLRAEQFGTDGKRGWILSKRCIVSGRADSDPAHVLESRGAGGGAEGMAPLNREVHVDFDNLGQDRFLEKWGVSKEDVREHARQLELEWQEKSDDYKRAFLPPDLDY